MTRFDLAALKALYDLPFFRPDLAGAGGLSRELAEHEVQLCTLMSIKTGGCSEDCSYCAQSAHYSTGLEREALAPLATIVETAQRARANGSTRFCMGAAWKGITEKDAKFPQGARDGARGGKLGMEVCVTLGQLTPEAARQLRAAGVTAYNHNLDTSPEFYPNIVTTHTFDDRLDTIRSVQAAGMSVCCGGIIGMGETEVDRLKMLEVLCGFDPAPESVPINCLMPMEGTPLSEQKAVDIFQLVRLIATTRIALPKARVRLSAGRTRLSKEGQALCFFAGSNSIFYGDKLLTAANPGVDADRSLLQALGSRHHRAEAASFLSVAAVYDRRADQEARHGARVAPDFAQTSGQNSGRAVPQATHRGTHRRIRGRFLRRIHSPAPARLEPFPARRLHHPPRSRHKAETILYAPLVTGRSKPSVNLEFVPSAPPGSNSQAGRTPFTASRKSFPSSTSSARSRIRMDAG
jgi:biotin synthase